MKHILHIVLFSVFLIPFTGPTVLMAQQSNTFFLLHDVPQSNLLNPAVQLKCKYYIGFPVIASLQSNYSNTAFTYNDLAGSDTWGFETVYDQMHRTDLVAGEFNSNLIALGYRHKRHYFTFNISERIGTYNTIPKELIGLALHGNSGFIGENAKINGLRPSALYFREYAAGYSRVIDSYFTLGARAKMLFGKAGVYPGKSKAGLTTDATTFDLLLNGDYSLNSSFPMTISDSAGNVSIDFPDPNSLDYMSLLMNRRNIGIAFDFGVIYHYNEKITLSASMLDLGFIKWRSDVNNVNVTGTFNYTGAPPDTDFTSGNYFQQLLDSIREEFYPEFSQDPFISWLPAQIFLGGTYQLRENIYAGLTNRNVIFRHKIHSSFTLSGIADIADRLLATVSWSYLNNSVKNFGAGLALYGRGMQFHIVSDNLLGFFQPFDTRAINIRVGFNLMLGCPREREKKIPEQNYSSPPEGCDCSWAKIPEFRKQYRKEAAKRNKSRK